jgi:hypothetical protein
MYLLERPVVISAPQVTSKIRQHIRRNRKPLFQSPLFRMGSIFIGIAPHCSPGVRDNFASQELYAHKISHQAVANPSEYRIHLFCTSPTIVQEHTEHRPNHTLRRIVSVMERNIKSVEW